MIEENISQDNLKFGRYNPVKILGEGAMGRVYLAEDPFLQRKLAIKVIILDKNLDDATRNEYNQRFILEAQSSAKLNHPSIVTIHDVGNDNGVPWIVFEFVEGESLIDILNRDSKLSLEQAITIALHIASALSVAHHHQIIHRDIKPANILVDSMTHIAKLADFGIAKAPWTELTQEGKTIGSPGYMSPEQIKGEPLDERTDIFSLGVVLYQMLTGSHPFLRDTLTNTLYATIEGTFKPIEDFAPDAPKALREIVADCLAPEKEKRIATANILVKRLKELHLASKTAHFTFSEFNANSTKSKKHSNVISNYLKSIPISLKNGSKTIVTLAKKLDLSFIHKVSQRVNVSSPFIKRVLEEIKKRKIPLLIGFTVFVTSFVLCINKLPSLISPQENIVPVEKTKKLKGIEKVKLSNTEEQLIAQVKNLISENDLDEAETVAKTISQTKNISAYGYMLLGLIYLKDEEYDDAYDAFEQCLNDKKGDKIIKENLNSLLVAVKEELGKEDAEEELLQIVVKTFNAAKNPIVNNWLNQKQYWVRWNAVYIKQRANLPIDTVKVFILDLQHAGSVRTRVKAAKALGRLGDKRAIEPLKEAANLGFSDPILSVTAENVLEEDFNQKVND